MELWSHFVPWLCPTTAADPLAAELQPSRLYDVLLWLSIAAILGVGVKALAS